MTGHNKRVVASTNPSGLKQTQIARRSYYPNTNGIPRTSLKTQEYAKFLIDKKALIIIIFGQCNEATKTEISLGATYAGDRAAGNLINSIDRLRINFFGGDDSGLSYGPYPLTTRYNRLLSWRKTIKIGR